MNHVTLADMATFIFVIIAIIPLSVLVNPHGRAIIVNRFRSLARFGNQSTDFSKQRRQTEEFPQGKHYYPVMPDVSNQIYNWDRVVIPKHDPLTSSVASPVHDTEVMMREQIEQVDVLSHTPSVNLPGQIDTQPPDSTPDPPASDILSWRDWTDQLFKLSAHIVILAGSGSGKTRTARGFVRYIVEERNESVIILDPKANLDTWMGHTAITNAEQISKAMRELLAEFGRRLELNPTLTEEEANKAFERIWIVVDEVSFINDNCDKVWKHFLRRISSMARSLKMHLLVVNQSERVGELGLKDRGDLLANFTKVYLSNAGWTGAPARIDYGELVVKGEWLSYFPTAYQGSQLSTDLQYRPKPLAGVVGESPTKDEFDDPFYSKDEARILRGLREWGNDQERWSVSAIQRRLGQPMMNYNSCKAALLQLQQKGVLDEHFSLL